MDAKIVELPQVHLVMSLREADRVHDVCKSLLTFAKTPDDKQVLADVVDCIGSQLDQLPEGAISG